MAPLRSRTMQDTTPPSTAQRPLRIVASGTLFLTHTLSLPKHPAPSTVSRAQSVVRTRGGSASIVLSLLAQFPAVDANLVASLGGIDEGAMILKELQKEGVNTKYCKIRPGVGAPSAWVLHSAETGTKTVINHNPLPDITHEEFVSLLGPLLCPENYFYPSSTASPTVTSHPYGEGPSGTRSPQATQAKLNPFSPAPFDWLHFEGRSVKTTLSNINGVDGLARERKWRSHCVFSVDVGRRGKQGVEALIPHADVLFVNKHYAQTQSPHYTSTPRAFLLSLTNLAPPHALLVAHWGSDGAAALSMPTREYFQSSGWVEERNGTSCGRTNVDLDASRDGVESVRTGSDFWAAGQTPSSSAFTLGVSPTPFTPTHSRSRHRAKYDDDNESQLTETPACNEVEEEIDEVGSQDAFVAGMIFALSRKMIPGSPYTPAAITSDIPQENNLLSEDKGRWRLEECLRFATELAGRKARRKKWDGLADEMARAGWFNE